MFKGRMKPIAFSEGIVVYCPENGRYSFFNSPYPMHCSYAGVDIYPERSFGDVAPSPVKGEVIRVRLVKCPPAKGFKGLEHDYLVLLRSLENPKRWVKLLHVEPLVKPGDKVDIGEDLGTLIRPGFFNFWTDPHIHVEVKRPSDPIRARGGFKFERSIEVDNTEAVKDLKGIVIESRPEYLSVALDEKFKHGIPVKLNSRIGILDAGIPHYRWMGIHVNNISGIGKTVKLCGRNIGTVRSTNSKMCIAECDTPIFTLNEKPVGLSFYLYLSSPPLMKVIPHRLGSLALKKFQKVYVTIS